MWIRWISSINIGVYAYVCMYNETKMKTLDGINCVNRAWPCETFMKEINGDHDDIKACSRRNEDKRRFSVLDEHGKGSTSDKRKTDRASSGHRSSTS